MGSIRLRQIGGFENNKWRVDYRFRKRGDVQQYEHKTIGIKIYIEDEKRSDGIFKIKCLLYEKGKPFIGYVSGQTDLERSMEEIFKRLIAIEGNMKVLFDGIFK